MWGRAGMPVDMTFVDHDMVEESNLGRQNFCFSELNWPKSETMALRLNAAFGLQIRAVPVKFQASFLNEWWFSDGRKKHCLLIGAVDNHLARCEMAGAACERQGQIWWLDCGNAHHNGQVLIGNLGLREIEFIKMDALGLVNGLPAPHLQAPDLLAATRDPDDDPALSCAELTVREEQSLVVNQMVAAVASQYGVISMIATNFSPKGTVRFSAPHPLGGRLPLGDEAKWCGGEWWPMRRRFRSNRRQ